MIGKPPALSYSVVYLKSKVRKMQGNKLGWRKPGDIIRDFNTARTVKNNRAIFMINKNDYRLIVEINYKKGWVFIKFTGTHAEYAKVDAGTINKFNTHK